MQKQKPHPQNAKTFFYFLQKYKIAGHSMMPTLHDGQQILVSKIPYFFTSPKINDIIVFKKESDVYIKRIKKIKYGGYFVQGDNNKDSYDSKVFGYISKHDIMGKVIKKI